MKILIITNVFYPDNVSVSQHMTDLAIKLVKEGHEVFAYTSCFPYEEKNERYSRSEIYSGVKIFRLNHFAFGKGDILARIFDIFTFYVSISVKLVLMRNKEFDLVIASTSPPLLSVIGVILSKIKKIKFCYWVMDLQPELSISYGLLRPNSLTAKVLLGLGNFAIRNSSTVISLDRFMTKYLISRGASTNQIKTIPVWPVADASMNCSRISNPFRVEHGFGDRNIIMYSGNHSMVHKLDTLLEAALLLRHFPKYLFVFVGGGVRKRDVTNFKNFHRLENILQLPYQPRENIHNSLSAADIQVVILGDGQVGYTHPNKIYTAMFIGKPILYIGPNESHISDILDNLEGNISVRHGDSKLLAANIERFFSTTCLEIDYIGNQNRLYSEANFHPELLKDQLLNALVC